MQDDDADFYGKNYWLERQRDHGTADIFTRARNDLTERNLYWLKALLKYRLPPAKVLELGCSHGSFVALMRHAGFDASGVEMSPWVVEFGQQTFGVPVSIGPVETLDMPAGSVDVLVAMDVLEHLPDPAKTMARCLELLKPDGLLLIQTPQFKDGSQYETLVKEGDRFLEMLIPEEHIYLFSQKSVAQFFGQLGASYLAFERAIFDHYDMFLVVSKNPLQTHSREDGEAALQASPSGRIATALLDLRERELDSLADRIARGEQIETLTRLVHESESDRAARGEQIATLTDMVKLAHAQMSERDIQLQVRQAELASRDRQLAARDTQLAARDTQLAARESQLAEQHKQVEEKEREISSLLSDVRGLFRHPAFRWIAKLGRWREAEKLEKRIEEP
ncbi:methyltransferase domain-containing protein [Paraburkholderia edwinii]|uniref:Methyltransferase domain-containing protein n=1 Tax=Paraburkholderia edwinii TaxID=2861782 RepID=A0ABX8UG55_9BURK|nr:class I SAM-dependent methyltransferase [Paraburkholderia edwinii]QYD67851.1 methyltransferase domain-containing protein [Paraburkholderia edwinii]